MNLHIILSRDKKKCKKSKKYFHEDFFININLEMDEKLYLYYGIYTERRKKMLQMGNYDDLEANSH